MIIYVEDFIIFDMGKIEPKIIRLKIGQNLVIRTAQHDDAADILEHGQKIIAEDSYNITTQGELNMTVEQEQHWIQKRLENPANIILLAEIDGCLAAMAHFENGSRKRTAHRGTVRLNVHSDFRRIGIASALMETLIEWARENPIIEKLCLSVFENNTPAIALYEKLGFIEEGRYKKEIKLAPDQYFDVIRMYKFVKD